MKKLSKGFIPLSVACGVACLSMITGFLSGVNPLKIMMRGLVSAAFAAGFVFFVDWLIKAFLPELSDLGGGSAVKSSDTSASGGNVNIVMPDEMPEPAQAAREAETASSDPESSGNMGVFESPDGNPSENEIAESIERVHNNKPEESDTAAAAADTLDTLPNLDSLEINIGSAGEDTGSDDTVDSVAPSPSRGGGEVDLGGNDDPEIIAKAVKTVLARDQQK